MSKLVQLADARKDKEERLRREYERVLFNRILGSYTYIEKLGLKGVEMVDISKSGCSFRMPASEGAFAVGEEMDFRFYFSQNTYLPCRIQVKRVTPGVENGVRYNIFGCSFDSALSTFEALERFVDFVDAYAKSAREDKGDARVWF
jgi:hypothetical protein